MRQITRTARLFTPLAAVLLLAACGGAEEEDVAYEADVEDLSGGEMIVENPADPAVPVDLPEVEMTNVPLDDAGNPVEPAAEPAPETPGE